ncbi:hypothetical protein FHG87_008333 [Trinorchestia longiramus]|nr:hypothetical protein FHG87_008333 [Trinorchestia longiramus]
MAPCFPNPLRTRSFLSVPALALSTACAWGAGPHNTHYLTNQEVFQHEREREKERTLVATTTTYKQRDWVILLKVQTRARPHIHIACNTCNVQYKLERALISTLRAIPATYSTNSSTPSYPHCVQYLQCAVQTRARPHIHIACNICNVQYKVEHALISTLRAIPAMRSTSSSTPIYD